MNPGALVEIQVRVVPLLNALESSLAKASITGPLDQFRTYLGDQVEGLSQRLISMSPARLGEDATDAELTKILNEFLGAQNSVFEGGRLVATGDV